MAIPEKRDAEETRVRLTEWLMGVLPGADSTRVAVYGGSETTGFSSDTQMFDLTWSRGGELHTEKLVARLAPTSFPTFPSYDLGVQFRALKILGRTDVPVPGVRWYEEDPTLLGSPFYVMDRVEIRRAAGGSEGIGYVGPAVARDCLVRA